MTLDEIRTELNKAIYKAQHCDDYRQWDTDLEYVAKIGLKLLTVAEAGMALMKKDVMGVGPHSSVLCDRLVHALAALEAKP